MAKKWTVAGLSAFLFVFLVWFLIRPADAFSQSERRPLEQFPAPEVKTVLDGSWMSDFETYVQDQFPLREQFRTLKALFRFDVLHQKDSHGVYLADGYASQLEYPQNDASLEHAAERFQSLYDQFLKGTDVNLYLSIIPDKNAFLAPSHGYPALDYDAFYQAVQARTPYLRYLDITDLLSLEDYYTTDLHWRQERITDVAQRLAEGMGVSLPESDYTEETLNRPYYGVYCGYAALPLPAEELHYFTSETLEQCTVYNYETNRSEPVYDLEKAAGKDPYELFLSGSVSLLRLENPNAQTDRKLVIFRDSFGSSLAPLLAEGYASITLVDIRYLPSASVGKFLEFTNQDVLFLYSVPVLNSSETLK